MAQPTAARVLKRIAVLCICVLVVSGCAPEERIPTIVDDHTISPVYPAPKLVPPLTHTVVNNHPSAPQGWIPPAAIERQWTAIVVHHSGTPGGNAAIFDKWHREGRHWEGVGYDFVIGNGTDSPDGRIEVTFRWLEQKTGAHCKTPDNWANERGIGICLVGNFDKTRPTRKQLASLARLVRFLQQRYHIPMKRIFGHKTVPGANKTDCPGKYFPMGRLKAML